MIARFRPLTNEHHTLLHHFVYGPFSLHNNFKITRRERQRQLDKNLVLSNNIISKGITQLIGDVYNFFDKKFTFLYRYFQIYNRQKLHLYPSLCRSFKKISNHKISRRLLNITHTFYSYN